LFAADIVLIDDPVSICIQDFALVEQTDFVSSIHRAVYGLLAVTLVDDRSTIGIYVFLPVSIPVDPLAAADVVALVAE